MRFPEAKAKLYSAQQGNSEFVGVPSHLFLVRVTHIFYYAFDKSVEVRYVEVKSKKFTMTTDDVAVKNYDFNKYFLKLPSECFL